MGDNQDWQERLRLIRQRFEKFFLQKDKMILVILAGILLFVICLPVKKSENALMSLGEQKVVSSEQQEDNKEVYKKKLEKELTELLENMEGTGKVKVMITLKASQEKILARETPYTNSKVEEIAIDGSEKRQEEKEVEDTVVYGKDYTGNEQPYVVKELEPQLEGVFIVAEGGDNPEIKMQITEAVQALFGIEAHKIKIVKMKS